MNERVQALVEGHGVRNCRIVEVGCGDGYFLRQLVQAGHNEGIGFDPSYRGALTAEHMTIETRYYDASCAHTPADVLICRHVIEHIPDLVAFLCEIRRALLSAPHARVFFETPCVRWILDKLVWWDVYYEHCNYFSQQSLALAFALAGFHVKSIEHVFEGQYLWLEAVPAKNAPCPLLGQGTGDLLALTQRFGQQELEMRQQWTRGIASLERPIALLGAAGKGVAFMNLLDPDHTAIACVVDLNPQKQGKYLPGTGHPIVDYPTLVCYGIRTAILLNPNYRRETLQLLHTYQLPIRLIG